MTSSRQGDQIRDLTRQLEDKTKENASLARQLEISLVDAKRADSEGKEKSNAREREFQSQVSFHTESPMTEKLHTALTVLTVLTVPSRYGVSMYD